MVINRVKSLAIGLIPNLKLAEAWFEKFNPDQSQKTLQYCSPNCASLYVKANDGGKRPGRSQTSVARHPEFIYPEIASVQRVFFKGKCV